MRKLLRQPFDDVLACLERLIDPSRRRQPPTVLIVVFVSLVITWFIYVPIHELLHVGGCVWTGGEVSRLELSPRYGAAILKKFFPFVTSGSDYAGQLKGFDTHGSDLCYMATVFAPFVLTVLIGVPLVKLAGRARRPVLLGVAIVVGLAPFYNMPGDYYESPPVDTDDATSDASESASVTSAEDESTPPVSPKQKMRPAFAGIRSDDIYLLVGTIIDDPSSLGLTSPGRIIAGCLLVVVSLLVDIALAFVTYFAGHLFSLLILPRVRQPGGLP